MHLEKKADKIQNRNRKQNTIIKEITDFDLEQTLECGQCFRFYKQDEEDYVVVAFNKLLHIKQSGNQLIFLILKSLMWKTYGFHILTLKEIIMKLNLYLLKKDSKLEEAIKEKWGIR